MKRKTQTLLWIGLIISILLGLFWQFYPLPDAQDRMNQLPLSGKGFIGKNEPLTAFEASFFKGVNIAKRIYNVAGQEFFIAILDGTHNRHIVHDPYYCFRGTGWTIDSERPFPLPRGQAALIQISKNGEQREALFWFTDGTKQYTSPLYYWWQTTLRRLTLGRSGPEPILVIVQPLSDHTVNWDDFKKAFPELFQL